MDSDVGVEAPSPLHPPSLPMLMWKLIKFLCVYFVDLYTLFTTHPLRMAAFMTLVHLFIYTTKAFYSHSLFDIVGECQICVYFCLNLLKGIECYSMYMYCTRTHKMSPNAYNSFTCINYHPVLIFFSMKFLQWPKFQRLVSMFTIHFWKTLYSLYLVWLLHEKNLLFGVCCLCLLKLTCKETSLGKPMLFSLCCFLDHNPLHKKHFGVMNHCEYSHCIIFLLKC